MITDYAAGLLLDHLFGVATLTPPAGLWAQLHVGDPGQGGDNSASETSRQAVTFTAPVTRDSTNVDALIWPAMAATETVSHLSIWDDSTGGDCWLIGSIDAPEDVTAGEPFTIDAGKLLVSFGDQLTIWSANRLLGLLLLGQAFTPGNYYVQLHSGPSGSDAASNALPVARATLGVVAAAAGRYSTNVASVEWSDLPTTAVVTHLSVWDDPAAGNSIWQGPLVTPRAVNAGSGAMFPPANLLFGL